MIRDTLLDVRVWASYNATDEENCRAQAIMESFDQKALVQSCKETRGDSNIACAIQSHWSMGTRNLVLEARFSDGVRWVLKIYMLAPEASNQSCFTSSISGSASDQTPDGDEIYETFQREFEAMEFIRFVSLPPPISLFSSDSKSSHTKLPVPTPHFLVHLPSSLGPTACLAMDLVQGVTGAFIFDRQHDKGNPRIKRNVRLSQHRALKAMAEIQITLAQFQAPVGGYLRNSPHSEHKCFMVDNSGNRSEVDSFGVGADPVYRTPLDFYTRMVAKRARRLDTINNRKCATSAHEILRIIKENMSSCCSDEPCFYLTNVDLGARNAIFDTRGILQAIIDVDALRFVPIEYAVQVPGGLGLEFFPDSASSVWRADDKSRSVHMLEYRAFLFAAGARCGQYNLGIYFPRHLKKDSAALIQGFEVVDEEDAAYNDEWLGSESVLRLVGQKPVTDSSIPQHDVQNSAA